MPLRCADFQARFTWELSDNGAPVTDVILLGGIPYAAACPLCGMMHELPRASGDGATLTPRCLLREYASQRRAIGQSAPWQTMYEAWLKEYPDAAAHTTVTVRLTTLAELNQRPALRVIASKRTRRKAKAA